MKAEAKEIQYTIRGVPREGDAALRQKAKPQKLSLNQAILAELAGPRADSLKKPISPTWPTGGRPTRASTRSWRRNAPLDIT